MGKSSATPKKSKEDVKEQQSKKLNENVKIDEARLSVVVEQKETGKIPTRSRTANAIAEKLQEVTEIPKTRKRTVKTTKKTIEKEGAETKEIEREEEIEEVIETPKKTTKKKKSPTLFDSDDSVDTSSSSSSKTTTEYVPSYLKKYSEKEIQVIQQENKVVMYKFIIFSILMFLIPLASYSIFTNYVADYLGINRDDRVTYGGVISVLGLLGVMASYSVMAYYEK